jgi:hypothetical protein
MKCADARELISSHLDNKPAPMKDALLAEHIKSCPACWAELEFQLIYRRILFGIKPVPAPENFIQELHRKIELEKGGGRLKNLLHYIKNTVHRFRLPLEAAGVAAVAVTVFFLYKPFFSDRAPAKITDYAAQAPSADISGKKTKPEIAEDSIKNIHVKGLPGEKKTDSGADKIISDEIIPEKDLSKKADTAGSFSEQEKKYESPSVADKKKSRFMIMEEDSKAKEEKFTADKSMDSKVISSVKKEKAKPGLSDAENIFLELEVQITSKNILNEGRIYYKLKVQRDRFSSLIRKLKQKYSVREKVLLKHEKVYEIEIFLSGK